MVGSPLEGHRVAAYEGYSPDFVLDGTVHRNELDAWHMTANGATVIPPMSIGDPTTAADYVFVDGRIITAENQDSATLFGQTLAQRLLSA